MDDLLRHFEATPDDDLMISARAGVAYQRNMRRGRIAYDDAYLANFDEYAKGPIAAPLNASRVAMLERHVARDKSVIDWGAGSGEFVRRARAHYYECMGYDVIPEAASRLRRAEQFDSQHKTYDCVILWDSLEHMDNPGEFLRNIKPGATVLVSIPIFDDLTQVRKSKHYKPGEHFYYFTRDGFIRYMAMYEFRLLEESDHEVRAGRESIGAFAFVRDLPGYREHIAAYKEMHFQRHYGSSATGLYLQTVARVVRELKPKSILDYGCGRSDLVAHFWRDGERQIARYDPAISGLADMPANTFDLVLVCDVMEHIPILYVDKILSQIRNKGRLAVFTISTRLARAKLPDGRNAHVTLMTGDEWAKWIKRHFQHAAYLPTHSPDEVAFLAGDVSAWKLARMTEIEKQRSAA